VRELVTRGQRVRGVNRSGHADVPSVVEMLKADATNPSSMREVCQGAAVLYNCVNPPFAQWIEMFPAVMEAPIEGAAAPMPSWCLLMTPGCTARWTDP
jgi:hypothetical protein